MDRTIKKEFYDRLGSTRDFLFYIGQSRAEAENTPNYQTLFYEGYRKYVRTGHKDYKDVDTWLRNLKTSDPAFYKKYRQVLPYQDAFFSGKMHYDHTPPRIHLEYLFVQQHKRNKGIGTRMMNEVLKEADSICASVDLLAHPIEHHIGYIYGNEVESWKKIHLDTDVFNKRMIQLVTSYKKFGFKAQKPLKKEHLHGSYNELPMKRSPQCKKVTTFCNLSPEMLQIHDPHTSNVDIRDAKELPYIKKCQSGDVQACKEFAIYCRGKNKPFGKS